MLRSPPEPPVRNVADITSAHCARLARGNSGAPRYVFLNVGSSGNVKGLMPVAPANSQRDSTTITPGVRHAI